MPPDRRGKEIGFYAQIGTYGSAITLSQVLTGAVAGQSYSFSFVVKNDLPDSPSAFQALWNGMSMIDLASGMSSDWTPCLFTATATGNDTLTFSFLHDTATISLTNVSAAPVPIPGALLLFGPGVAGIAVLRRRFKKWFFHVQLKGRVERLCPVFCCHEKWLSDTS